MTSGKELVLSAIELKKVERIPWVPFCGVHSGSLIGENSKDFLLSSDNIVNGIAEAVKRYRPDGIPVVFDLQIEAEIFGCELKWAEDNPPAVISHPLAEGKVSLEELKLPTSDAGRIPTVMEASRRIREQHPDIALYGLITGPFTLALHLLGSDIFMKMYDEPDYIAEVMDFCTETAKAMSEMYIENGCDIVAVVDPMTSQIGADHFVEFCSESCRKVFDHIRAKGAKSSFFVCGHAQNNIEVMCDCKCDSISIDENISLEYVKKICLDKKVAFGGNMELTTGMLLGTPEDNMINAFKCMDIGGVEGFILAPGCDMPYATPPENVEAIAEVVHDSYKFDIARELAKNPKKEIETIDLKSHWKDDKVIIDIITLDSEGCAPCQYMVEAVDAAAAKFGDAVEWKEHKIKNKEGVAMMATLKVRSIPTICIDGEIAFISRIPAGDKLSEVISDRLKNKKQLV